MAQKLTSFIMSHKMQKHYLALVDGKMEVGKEILIDQPLYNFKGSGVCTVDKEKGRKIIFILFYLYLYFFLFYFYFILFFLFYFILF